MYINHVCVHVWKYGIQVYNHPFLGYPIFRHSQASECLYRMYTYIHIYIYMCWCIHYLEIHVWSIWVSFWNWGTPFHPFIWSSFSHEHIGHELEAIPHFQTRSCLGFTNQKHQSNMSAALQFISPSLHLIGVALADFADLGEGIGLVGKFRCSSTSQTKRYTSSDSPLHNNVSGV